MRCWIRLSLLLFLFPAVPMWSANLGEQFESRYHSASSLQVTFLERYLENSKPLRAEAGIAYFRRPGRMRWDYESPEKNLFLIDGKWAWFYVPADHTVTRVPAKQSSDWRTPIALLADNPKLSKICSHLADSTSFQPETPGNNVLFCLMRGSKLNDNTGNADLESRASSQGDAVFLEINPQTGILSRILVTQPGGVSIEFKFTNWQFNPPLPESLFHFAVPPNTAIVNGELPSRENSANP